MRRFLIIVFSLFAMLWTSHAWAPMSVSMNPPKMEFIMKAGQAKQEVIELENKGVKSFQYRVYKTGFGIGEGQQLNFTEAEKNSAAPWISFVPETGEVKPYDYGVVRYKVDVPKGIPDGSYTAAVMIEEIKELPEGEQRAQFLVKGRFAHIVYVNIGKPQYQVAVESLSVSEKSDQVQCGIRLKNAGKYDYRPSGMLIIEKGKQKVKEVPIPTIPILRETTRTLQTTLPKDLPAGTYRVKWELDVEGQDKIRGSKDFTLTGKKG